MRIILGFSLLTLLASCSENQNAVEEIIPEKIENADLILGKWSMDSSVFFDSGVQSEFAAPMMPTTWIFSEDGSYKVKNSVEMPGTFSHLGDSLFVLLMDVPNEYAIVKLNETNLQLRSTIIETETASMITEAYLSRISN